jgi:hypothetical protein
MIFNHLVVVLFFLQYPALHAGLFTFNPFRIKYKEFQSLEKIGIISYNCFVSGRAEDMASLRKPVGRSIISS